MLTSQALQPVSHAPAWIAAYDPLGRTRYYSANRPLPSTHTLPLKSHCDLNCFYSLIDAAKPAPGLLILPVILSLDLSGRVIARDSSSWVFSTGSRSKATSPLSKTRRHQKMEADDLDLDEAKPLQFRNNCPLHPHHGLQKALQPKEVLQHQRLLQEETLSHLCVRLS